MFVSQYVYISFISSVGGEIEVKPVFVDPAKANSIKYVTGHDTNKMDSSETGVDTSKLPPQKTMVNDF